MDGLCQIQYENTKPEWRDKLDYRNLDPCEINARIVMLQNQVALFVTWLFLILMFMSLIVNNEKCHIDTNYEEEGRKSIEI